MGIFAGGKAARASGGTVITAGPYTVHAFTTTGANTFTPAATGFIDVLLVGGGGAGSGSPGAGGGGAGATLFKKMIPVTASTPYPISVGAGGPSGVSGTPTTFIYSGITTTASGGGFGGPDSIPGDGALYKGCILPHWRDPMKGNKDSYYHQVFFHYVRRNGHCVQHAYDRG